MKISGVDYSNNEKRLLLCYDNGTILHEISRTIHDIKRIARGAKGCRANDSPIHIYKIPKELKKIFANDVFRVNGNGYNKSMIKCINVSEIYLNFVLDNTDVESIQNFINEEKYQQNVQSITDKRINEKKPRLLQQFFTKYNDINDLINSACIDIDNDILSNANTIFIEPSCGDGRILLELCKRNYKCIGIDIDAQILEIAKANLESYFNNNLLGLISHDFLTLSKSQLPIVDSAKHIIVIGNPPFRDSLGSDQDYTIRFIAQCKEWGISRVAFILPSRSGKNEFINKISKDWKIVHIKDDLEGKFSFMDKEISQPSIILVVDLISLK